LQTVAEGLLFYHPAVWWISAQIRTERENCCDDMVVAMTGDAEQYALALTSLAETGRSLALAANGGSLVNRIRRLLLQPEGPRPVVAVLLLTATCAAALFAFQTPTNYLHWVQEDVAYIITDQERAAFQQLGADAERERFVQQFWERRDPTPGTPRNEMKEEHYRRIAYANQRFATSSGLPGWKTDRGRIYIMYGTPDEMNSAPSGGDGVYPYEQWRYRFIESVGNNVIIEFVDKAGNGEYHWTMDPKEKRIP
jgi:GWxTD domain-containing protein